MPQLAQASIDGFQQILGLFLAHDDVGIANNTEQVRRFAA